MTALRTHIKGTAQGIIRAAHGRWLNRGLPRKVGLLFHSLEPASYSAFRGMVHFFREADYRFASPDTFLESASERCVLVSFDDNYRTWYDALALLEMLEVQATFYTNTCVFYDRATEQEIRTYYDRLDFEGTRVPLSTTELRALVEAGHTVGAHTHSHFRLTVLPLEQAKEEIRVNKAALEKMLGREVRHFAYPFGMRRHFNSPLRAYCQKLGFATVAQAIPAMQHAPQRPYALNRSPWKLDRPRQENLENIGIDGRYFARLTGRSAVG